MAENSNSQSSNKVLIGIIIVVVLALVILGSYRTIKRFARLQMQGGNNVAPVTQSQTASTMPSVPTNAMTNTNSSNAQLDQDLQNIQTQLNQLNSDQNTVVQSLQNQSNDTPQQ